MSSRRAALVLALLLTGAGCEDVPVTVPFPEPVAAAPRDAGAERDEGTPDAGPPPPDHPVFTEVANAAGITLVQHSGPDYCRLSAEGCEVPSFAGGVAIGDVDDDGWPDVYVTALDRPGTLYRNVGDGTFEDVTLRYGLANHAFGTNGAAFGDLDKDGDLDLYVSVVDYGPMSQHLLFLQEDGAFVEDARRRGAAVETSRGHSGTSVALGDYDLDGYLDIHVSEWLAYETDVGSLSRLLHNRGAPAPGVFEDTTTHAGVDANPVACFLVGAECDIVAFGAAFEDLDEDGWPDMLLVQDNMLSRLFWNQGDGTFLDGTEAAGVGTDPNGMGSTVGDYDGDGDLDWFVSSIGDNGLMCGDEPCRSFRDGNRLYRNEGQRVFVDATDEADVRMSGWSWGTAFFDHDNDGDLDLIVANGFDDPMNSRSDDYVADPMRFWDNVDGAFVPAELSRGLTDVTVSTGLAVFDYDRDGDQDVLIMRPRDSPLLYRNDGGNENAWLRVRLTGTGSNPHGLGAQVRVQVTPDGPWLRRQVSSVTHFQGQSEYVAHFGLGPDVEVVASLEVRWPSGLITERSDVEARQIVELTEPAPL